MLLQAVQLMEGCRNYINNYGQVKRGDKVLIVADNSSDPMVIDGLAMAAKDAGAAEIVVTITHDGPLGYNTDNYFDYFLKDWPVAVKEAAFKSDVVFNLTITATGRMGIHKEFFKNKVRFVRVSIRTAELMASEWAKFPIELRDLIEEKAKKQASGKKKWHHKDPEGTDIIFEASGEFGGSVAMKEFVKHDVIMFGIEPKEPKTCNGVIVSSATHHGPIPQIRITIEKGKVSKLEGGGKLGRKLPALFEKYKDQQFGDFGPGVDWLDELMWACHPKGQGSRMAGTIHHSIGGGPGSHGKVKTKGGPAIGHFGLVTFNPTLTADGVKIIDNGHITVLDDPEVRAMAARYGDPDDLLSRGLHLTQQYLIIPPLTRTY